MPAVEIQGGVTVYCGDALTRLRELPDQSVHCVVTSPPYWGLRDYGTGRWEGGDLECDHKAPLRGGLTNSGLNAKRDAAGNLAPDRKSQPGETQYAQNCAKCGARRIDDQLGLEATPGEYTARLVEVFDEVRRVLRDDGTVWLNLGDSYSAASGGGQGRNGQIVDRTASRLGVREGHLDRSNASGLAPKNLCLIPARTAIALQEAGWWVRMDIIWAKPNPMPESVTDRPTKSHEYVWLLSKSDRYWYDGDAIAEPAKSVWDSRDMIDVPGADTKDAAAVAQGLRTRGGNTHHPAGPRYTANRRSVWTITTKPYTGAHFATFPPELPRLCILAGCPEGGVVLDPFAGAGTTLYVARELGRRSIGIELNPEYVKLIQQRCAQTVLFAP